MQDTPEVVFRAEIDGVSEMRIGYLVVINGIPWAFPLPDETDPLRAKAIRLDPSRLEEDRDNDGVLRGYTYRGAVVVRR
jgi:hypothetical protein